MSFVYLIPVILAIVWSIEYDRQEEFDRYKSHRFWLLYIILSLITGLSYALGGDKQTYLTEFGDYSSNIFNIFTEIELGFKQRGQMPGWVIVNCIAKSVFNSFYVVQIIEAFFINFAVFYTIKRYTQRTFFAVLVYCFSLTYFVFNLEVMREAFAIGFFLLGTDTYFQKKYAITVVLFFLACLFHVSAFVALLFPFMRFRITLKRFPFVLLASLLFYVLSNFVFKVLVSALFGQESAIFSRVLLSMTYSTPPIPYIIYTIIYLVAPFWILHLALQKGADNPELIRRKEQFMTFYLCVAIVVPAILPLARFLNYPRIIFLCMTGDLLYTLFTEKRHFVTKILCILIAWGYPAFQYIAKNPYTGTSFMDLFFPYTSIMDESYDRSYRVYLHDSTINDGPGEEYSRE